MNAGFEPEHNGSSAQPKTHVFKPNETLAEIATTYGLELSKLMEANNLGPTSFIFPGQKLVIPSKSTIPVPSILPQEHIVLRGETLLSIANMYGLKVSVLQDINELQPGSILFPGTTLKLISTKPQEPEISKDSRAPKYCLVHGYHKVKAGDQLSRIAAFHGVSTQSLLMANDLSWNSVVAPGSKLIVPISHNPYNCPSLVQLSTSSFDIATELVEVGLKLWLSEFELVVALCLEMQRSGLQADLRSKQLTEDLLVKLSELDDSELTSVRATLELIGFTDLAEGASLWEPSAWFWLHQIKSNNE